jgi:hypothetical protein
MQDFSVTFYSRKIRPEWDACIKISNTKMQSDKYSVVVIREAETTSSGKNFST